MENSVSKLAARADCMFDTICVCIKWLNASVSGRRCVGNEGAYTRVLKRC
jgi:hypothetical protein